VIPYYHAFLERFPTVHALAAAPTAEVIRAWAGLGYNRRAVNLQRTAQAVVEQYSGEFPQTVEELRQLPGIGPYTAGAIACFAFEQDVPFVDTNMRRVLHRLLVGVDVPSPAATDRELVALAQEAIPPGQGWEWNQALIEFGALQCTARKPACLVCPLQAECAAFPAIQTALATLPKGVRLKREAPFGGSNRFYRGRVIDALRQHPPNDQSGLDLHALGTLVRDDFTADHMPWLYEVVQGLSKDGLAIIAEDSPEYDVASPEPSAPTIRVRLP
jgi:A/G-specific adenine glycosylase